MTAGSGGMVATSRRRATAAVPFMTETWTGANGAAWPAAWTFTQPSGSGGTNTIQTNRGVLTNGTGAYAQRVAYQSTMTAASNMNLLITVMPLAQANGWFNVAIDSDNQPLSANGSFRQNGYAVQFAESTAAGSANTSLFKQVGNVQSTLSGAIGMTLTANTAYKLRLQRLGTTIRYRVWAAANAEPGTWTASVTDGGTQPPAGRVSLMVGNSYDGSVASVAFDDLSVAAT